MWRSHSLPSYSINYVIYSFNTEFSEDAENLEELDGVNQRKKMFYIYNSASSVSSVFQDIIEWYEQSKLNSFLSGEMG